MTFRRPPGGLPENVQKLPTKADAVWKAASAIVAKEANRMMGESARMVDDARASRNERDVSFVVCNGNETTKYVQWRRVAQLFIAKNTCAA